MTPGTPQFNKKREAILDGAARLFNLHGIKGATLADVARSVGLMTNSLTYYYRRKEDLAAACLMRSMEALCACADRAAREPAPGARVQALLDGYLAVLADIAAGRRGELVQLSDLLSIGAPHEQALQEAYTQMFRQVRALLREPGTAVPAASPGRDALNAHAHLLLSLTWWTRAGLVHHEPADHAEVARRIGPMLLHGLAAPGHRPAPPPASWPTLVPSRPAAGEDGGRATAYLCAAARQVNQHGVAGASVDRIATELGLTKGSFYHHHDTKEELIAACFERTFTAVRAAQDAARDAPGSGLDRLTLACRSLLRHQMSADGPLLRITAWMGLPDTLRRDAQRTMAGLGDRFAAFIVDGTRDGSVRALDAALAAQMINGMINAAAEIERWVPGVTAENVFDLYAMPLFAGLQPAP